MARRRHAGGLFSPHSSLGDSFARPDGGELRRSPRPPARGSERVREDRCGDRHRSLGVGFIPILPSSPSLGFMTFFTAAAAALAVSVGGVEKSGFFSVGCFYAVLLGADVLPPPDAHLRTGGGINLFGPPPTSLFPVASLGTGSSAMEFGHHHPLLGHLVMKHGGHKYLAELASLARIKRETSTWATFAIDSLPRHPARRRSRSNDRLPRRCLRRPCRRRCRRRRRRCCRSSTSFSSSPSLSLSSSSLSLDPTVG
jgi:hypothetical protein